MARKKSTIERFSIKATRWVGSTQSLIIHTTFFLISFILAPLVGVEKMLLLVTTIVSLEAIYLALFIQITINRQENRLRGVEEDVEDILEDTEELTEEEKVE